MQNELVYGGRLSGISRSSCRNPFNHYAYGAVGEWLYRYAAGVDTSPLDAGFHTILLHPNFDVRLGSLDFTHESRYGKIHSQWTARAGAAEWHVTIPANTTARLLIPSFDKRVYTIDGKPLTASSLVNQVASSGSLRSYLLDAGSYILNIR